MKVKEKRITLAHFISALRCYFLVILACAIVMGALGWVMAARKVGESYSATATVYVQPLSTNMDNGPTSTEIAIAKSLAASCAAILKNDALVENVKAHFAMRRADSPDENWEDIADYSPARILGMITVEYPSNSMYISITATAPTASLAVHLANAVAGETEVSAKGSIGNFRAIPNSSASQAIGTRTDNRIMQALAFAVIGALLSYALLVLTELLDNTIRRPAEAEDFSDFLPLLGVAHRVGRRVRYARRGSVTPAELHKTNDLVLREDYNRIRTNLDARLVGIDCPIIGVASPGCGEGGASCAINLAVSFARLGRRVLLVDANMRAARRPSVFGDCTNGLAQAVIGCGKAVPVASDIQGLSVLSRGASDENPTDLLGSRAFADLLKELAGDYDIIVVSFPPLLNYADAAAASRAVTGIVTPLALGHSDRRATARSLASLYNVGATLLGAIAVEV